MTNSDTIVLACFVATAIGAFWGGFLGVWAGHRVVRKP